MTVDGIVAYVGPGPGLTMVWAFLGLLGTIGLAILSLLILPFRLLIRRMRGTPAAPKNEPPMQETAGAPADPGKTNP